MYCYINIRQPISHNERVPHAALVEYPDRHARWTREHATLTARDRHHAIARLVIVGLGIAALALALRDAASWWWVLVPLAAFATLAQRHDRVIRERDAAARLLLFYERGLARLYAKRRRDARRVAEAAGVAGRHSRTSRRPG